MLDFVFRNETGMRPIVVAVKKSGNDKLRPVVLQRRTGLIQELGDSNGV